MGIPIYGYFGLREWEETCTTDTAEHCVKDCFIVSMMLFTCKKTNMGIGINDSNDLWL